MRIHTTLLSGIILSALLVGGCGSTEPARQLPSADATRSAAATDRAQALRAAFEQWRGTPHEWGGTTARGIDCSGLVQAVYRETLNQRLPRTTRAQAQAGAAVPASSVQPGDLVFFHVDTRKGRHVGIYLSDGDFLHASSSEGVTVSSLQNPYWDQRWWQARRLLADSAASPQTDSSSRPPRTIGW